MYARVEKAAFSLNYSHLSRFTSLLCNIAVQWGAYFGVELAFFLAYVRLCTARIEKAAFSLNYSHLSRFTAVDVG